MTCCNYRRIILVYSVLCIHNGHGFISIFYCSSCNNQFLNFCQICCSICSKFCSILANLTIFVDHIICSINRNSFISITCCCICNSICNQFLCICLLCTNCILFSSNLISISSLKCIHCKCCLLTTIN